MSEVRDGDSLDGWQGRACRWGTGDRAHGQGETSVDFDSLHITTTMAAQSVNKYITVVINVTKRCGAVFKIRSTFCFFLAVERWGGGGRGRWVSHRKY